MKRAIAAACRTSALLPLGLLLGLRAIGCATDESTMTSTVPEASTVPEPGMDGSPEAARVGDDAGADGDDRPLGPCSEDGWCRVDIPDNRAALYGIWGSSATDVWVVGSRGASFHWDGTAWSGRTATTDAGQPKPLFGVWGAGANDVWAFSTSELLHSDGWTEDGPRWSVFNVGTKFDTTSFAPKYLWGSGPSDIWMLLATNPVVGLATYKCWHATGWTDGGVPSLVGAMDHYKSANQGANFLAAWGTGARDVWLVGESGRIMHTDGYWGGMAEWTQSNSNTRSHLNGVWGTATDDVWAVGERGTIRHYSYDEGGELAWMISDANTTASLRAVWGSSATDVWAVGDSGTIVHGDGVTWTASKVPVEQANTTLYGIWGSGPDDVWAVGERVILHRAVTAGGVQ